MGQDTGLINKGIEEGATVVAGGPGKPDGLATGYYVKPTVLANVSNDKTVAREEIFGPVLVMIGYDTVDEAVQIANDTPYGLAAYVSAPTWTQRARSPPACVPGRSTSTALRRTSWRRSVATKQSGNGREWGDHAFAEFTRSESDAGVCAEAGGDLGLVAAACSTTESPKPV